MAICNSVFRNISNFERCPLYLLKNVVILELLINLVIRDAKMLISKGLLVLIHIKHQLHGITAVHCSYLHVLELLPLFSEIDVLLTVIGANNLEVRCLVD